MTIEPAGAVTRERRLANLRATLARPGGPPIGPGPAAGPRPVRRPAQPRPRGAARGRARGGRRRGRRRLGSCAGPSPRSSMPLDRERLARPARAPAAGRAARVHRHGDDRASRRRPGTLAFLVGLARWEGDAFRQTQLLLPDHADEPALLAEIAALGHAGRVARELQRPRVRLAADRGALPARRARGARPRRAPRPAAVRPARVPPPDGGRPAADRRGRAARRLADRRRRGLGDPAHLPRRPARRAGRRRSPAS